MSAHGTVMTNIASSMTPVSEFGASRQPLCMEINPRVGQVIAVDDGWTSY